MFLQHLNTVDIDRHATRHQILLTKKEKRKKNTFRLSNIVYDIFYHFIQHFILREKKILCNIHVFHLCKYYWHNGEEWTVVSACVYTFVHKCTVCWNTSTFLHYKITFGL